ncbi:AAA family ATPase [Corallococcus sp. BB11-1]|uniref:AAA family ATPase n=1 Tax=Corallococcus sp. BB11-1 TaxID=2996783 RepID=UPI002271E1FC|nr:AAA family ATPase [Corallococcus sp. BB11-1]MCY1033923.1 AAA family ATPase [Corallococcus sp. BB11-1]
MLEKLALKDVGPAPQLAFDFAPRLNLLTGDNGLGKTFILDVAWWVLTRSWPDAPAMPQRGASVEPTIDFKFSGKSSSIEYTSTYDFPSQSWTRRGGRPANPGMVLYARIDGSFSVWDPARNYWRQAPSLGIDEPDRPVAYQFAPQDVWNGLEPQGKIYCNGLIRDWATWQGRNGEAFHQLLLALQTLSPSKDEPLVPGELTRISIEDVRDMPTIKAPYGQQVAVIHASAGVKRIISLAYLLVWTWQEHVQASRLLNQGTTNQIIFLIDEIEAHLHPRWQRTILRSILDVMAALTGQQVDVQLLTVTHSPLLLASVEPLFDEKKDALWNLDLIGQQVELRREAWRRRGDANAWLTSDVFDLAEPRSLEAEQAIQSAEALMNRKDVQPAEFLRVQRDLRSSLPDVDSFWLRWGFWAQESGFNK